MVRVRILSSALFASIALACSPFGPDRERVVAALALGVPPVIEVEDTVQRGRSFSVTVRLRGGDCLEKGGITVDQNGSTAVVTPYQYKVEEDVCIARGLIYEQVASITFNTSGPATVIVRGRNRTEEIITLERSVVVQ